MDASTFYRREESSDDSDEFTAGSKLDIELLLESSYYKRYFCNKKVFSLICLSFFLMSTRIFQLASIWIK